MGTADYQDIEGHLFGDDEIDDELMEAAKHEYMLGK